MPIIWKPSIRRCDAIVLPIAGAPICMQKTQDDSKNGEMCTGWCIILSVCTLQHIKSLRSHQGHSVFEFNTDESQCLRRLGCEPAASRRYIGFARPPQEPNSTITERRHHLRDVATAHLRAVFIKCHITYPVQFVLNRPM